MAKQYRVNAFVRINNLIISSSLRMGISMGSFALLTVCGRKSGKPIETPIANFVHEGKSYLIASYGLVNWVRNLRAAGEEATLTRIAHLRIDAGTPKRFPAVELPPEEAAPIFARRSSRAYHDSSRKLCVQALPAFPVCSFEGTVFLRPSIFECHHGLIARGI